MKSFEQFGEHLQIRVGVDGDLMWLDSVKTKLSRVQRASIRLQLVLLCGLLSFNWETEGKVRRLKVELI
jgi:hypothetical protein